MGFGVAGQCSKQASRGVDSLESPIVAVEAEQVERLEKRPGHGPAPRFLCPSGPHTAVPRRALTGGAEQHES
jgi:hypothetical protein